MGSTVTSIIMKQIGCVPLLLLILFHTYGSAFRIYLPEEEDTEYNQRSKRQVEVSEAVSCISTRCLSLEPSQLGPCVEQCDRLNHADFLPTGPHKRQTEPFLLAGPAKRQDDAVQTCIRAKCAHTSVSEYGDCVFTRCIMGTGVKVERKRYWSDSARRDLDNNVPCILDRCMGVTGLTLELCLDSCNAMDTGDLHATFSKRQIDPLQSCIEAKCAGSNGHRYGDCVFSRCIMGTAAKEDRKRYWSDGLRDKRDSTCALLQCADKVPGSIGYFLCTNTKCKGSSELSER